MSAADPYTWPEDIRTAALQAENDALKAQVAELEAQVRWMGGDTRGQE